MDISSVEEGIPRELYDETEGKKRSLVYSFLNKILFFLIGASVTCIGSTGWLTSTAFGTEVFITDCYSVYFYVNIVAFLGVLLFIDCNYRNAIISGWLCVFVHVAYILIVALPRGELAKNLYMSAYVGIAVLEAFVIQSNSFVVSKYYSFSVFSNLYSGYYGGMAIFSLIQTIVQYCIGTDTQRLARICLILTHGMFTLIVFFAILTQTIIYFDSGAREAPEKSMEGLKVTGIKKLKGMYSVLHTMPKYSSRFLVFTLSDLCKCTFFQVFIPYRMLLNDTELIIIFFSDNICDILGRFVGSSANDSVEPKGLVKNHQKYLYFRDSGYFVVILLSWALCMSVVSATWTLKVAFLTTFPAILIVTIIVCLAMGYCSTRGMNGCIPILDYFQREGGEVFPGEEKKHYSYVNDLNTFFIKFLWMVVFIVVYFLGKEMEKEQATEHYANLKRLLFPEVK